MEEDIEQRLEDAEDRINELENQMKKVINYAQTHKHNIGNKLPTVNY